MAGPTIETERLILRTWRDADRAMFARMNADPEVMRYFPAPLDRKGSDELFDRAVDHFARHGYGMWAVTLRSDSSDTILGFTGLNEATFEAHFTPAIEIGWRLAAESQGHGYATEAARAVLDFAFADLQLPEIVSFTVVDNAASRRVMEKIGLSHDPDDDFDHPALPEDHALRRHVLYRLRRTQHS